MHRCMYEIGSFPGSRNCAGDWRLARASQSLMLDFNRAEQAVSAMVKAMAV